MGFNSGEGGLESSRVWRQLSLRYCKATILTVEMMLLAFEMNYVEAAWTLVP